MTLETKRLILRKPKISDWADIVEGLKEYDVVKMMTNVPHPYGKKDALKWLKKTIPKCGKGRYPFIIELKVEKKVIGCIDINNINEFSGKASTGSWVNKKYWRNGYMTEAKIALNDFAFNKLKLRRLDSPIFTDNKASNATQLKIGYKLEGTKKKAGRSRASGKIHDENIYGLLKEYWKKARPKLVANK